MPVGSSRVQKTNARIISATNQNLEKLIEDNLFREDLYFRLNVMPIFIPPLKERTEDIPSLIEYFLKKYREKGQNINFSQEAIKKLQFYSWPGNIRELENVIQRTLILTNGSEVNIDDLPENIVTPTVKKDPNVSLDFEKFKLVNIKNCMSAALGTMAGL